MTTSAPASTRPASPAWEEDKRRIRTEQAVILALATVGKVNAEGTAVTCPKCSKTAAIGKQFRIFPDGAWHHFSSGWCHGDAADILVMNGTSFADAVRYLAGKKPRTPITAPRELPTIAVDRFEATVDTEVYHGVCVYGRKTGGVEAAIDFYGQWHISPDAVRASGAILIEDTAAFEKRILERFGADRLIRSGLFVDTTKGPRSIIGPNFPVVEPHMHPTANVPVYLQLRASNAQHARYLEHKAGKRPYTGSEKFLSLRGAPRESQIGVGLPAIAAAPEGQTVYVVEGFKDVLAAGTFGVLAYGIPGVGYTPSPTILDVLRGKDVVVSLDGDTAGAANSARLVKLLTDAGVAAREHRLTDGMDITDRLVARNAAGGCNCAACLTLLSRVG